jgi:hypothetical protein
MEDFVLENIKDVFISCREEAKPMSDFLSSKDLRIHAPSSNWVIEID